MNIIIAILIFGFIIIFHEFGHFIVAKACDVKVNEFMVGLGPRICGFKRGETDFSIHLLPFGGACVMEGEESESDDDRSFQKKKVWQRFLIVFAGPLFNFILAFLLSIVLIAGIGYTPAKIGAVNANYPASEAGLKAGDEIVRLGNYNVHFYQEVSYYNVFHPGEKVEVTYIRDGKKATTTLTPKYDKASKRYLLGITAGKSVKANAITAVTHGFYQLKEMIYITVMSLRMLITGTVSVNDMSGPVGIVKVIGDSYNATVSLGVFAVVMQMIYMIVLLSANLGVMNLLPIPALDGGRLVLYIWEIITRKKPSEKFENTLNYAGFVILMGLMVLVMGNDIRKLFL
jgi:regulator of sigma E protease